ncbi:hypothetical protein OS493_029206 [Desmophyllum pertusum]|uniref:Uncharacterized protein n=1 Tax=Desmophyllum pertusum TaxID=174260 RepID=A0A9X0A191_9CNID|nr:hypothetical protein OS493_029206 [Desmophyllum pertusum]
MVKKHSSKYSRFPTEDKDNVKKLVYILDHFGVAIQAYHEVTQMEGHDAMARSYVLEECQAELNAAINIVRTPGQSPGAEMHFPDLLKELIEKHEDPEGSQESHTHLLEFLDRLYSVTAGLGINMYYSILCHTQVKIGGYGAAISHSSNLLVCSFAMLNDTNVMSSSGRQAG